MKAIPLRSLREYALGYAKRGWAVFPLARREKIPAVSKADGGNGCLDATADTATVDAWWERFPEANIGLHCGPASGVWVLDVDAKAPKRQATDVVEPVSGVDALRAFEELHGALPETRSASTGSGGWHLYFRLPPGCVVRNRVSIRSIEGARTGLDVRTEGGYVLLPPSIHPNGTAYAWRAGTMDLAEAPAWLLDLVAPAPAERPAWNRPAPSTGTGREQRYALAALDGVCTDIAKMTEGGRHEAINKGAFVIGGYVATGLLNEEEASAALIAAGLASGKGEREVRRTVADGLRAGQGTPRRAPEAPSRPVRQDVPPAGPPPIPIEILEPDGPSPASSEPPPDPPAFAHLTDLGNAKRLVVKRGGDLRAVLVNARTIDWFVWNDQRWVLDEGGQVMRWAKQIPDDIAGEAERIDDDDVRKATRKWARASESAGRLAATVTVASTEPGIPVSRAAMDADRWLFNTPTGTLDLRAGALREHRRVDLLTKMGGCGAVAGSECPTWLRFLDRIMGGNADLVGFLQRAAGYCLVGDTREQCVFILYGQGQTGKSTFLETLAYVWGDYAQTAATDTFMSKREGGIPNDLAALAGVRFVTSIETAEGRQLDEQLVKHVTGEEKVKARFLNREFFSFEPEFRLWLATNHRPVIRGIDSGIWRRLRLVPFEVVIPEQERDKELRAKLRAEAPGILKWAIEGCGWWRAEGLGVPAAVATATAEYQQEMDVVAGFLADRCMVDASASVDNAALYAAYVEWAKEQGEHPRSHRWFTRNLKDRGMKQSPNRMDGRRWLGLHLAKPAKSAVFGGTQTSWGAYD